MKKLRYWLRLFTALFAKYYVILGIGIVFGIITFFIFPRISKYLPKWRGTNSIAVVGRFTSDDIPLFIQHQISQGLTTLDSSGRASPAIATSWEVADGGKTYIFNLNPHLKWQDGTAFKGRDINYQFRDTIVEYPNDTKLIMKLKDPFAPLPIAVSRPVFKRGLLGTGSYKVSRVRKNGAYIESLSLVPVDKSGYQPNLIYRFYSSEASAWLAFKLGIVHSVMDLQDVGDLASWPNATVTSESHSDRYVAVFFNLNNSILSGSAGRNLRLALTYAIDKSRWPDRADGPINPYSWAYFSDTKKYNQDLIHAKQLLAKDEKQLSEIQLSTVPAYLPVAEAIKSDWEKLGLKVNVLVAAEPTADFTALVIAQAIPLDPDQYNLWHSTQATNLTGLNNPRIDKLLEDGRKALDFDERKKIYHEFQKYLVDEVPAIFLFHPQSYTVSRK